MASAQNLRISKKANAISNVHQSKCVSDGVEGTIMMLLFVRNALMPGKLAHNSKTRCLKSPLFPPKPFGFVKKIWKCTNYQA